MDPAADRRRRFERLVAAVFEPVQRYLLRRAARGCLANSRRGTARQERLVHRLAQQRTDEAEDDGALAEALAGLSAADQELLRSWAWEQLPPREIATVLGISANAAGIRLHRAKRRLREAFSARKDGDAAGQVGVRDGGGAA
ncbi:RNA polymerase sigma factor [Blastococcus sp. SYSU D00669]